MTSTSHDCYRPAFNVRFGVDIELEYYFRYNDTRARDPRPIQSAKVIRHPNYKNNGTNNLLLIKLTRSVSTIEPGNLNWMPRPWPTCFPYQKYETMDEVRRLNEPSEIFYYSLTWFRGYARYEMNPLIRDISNGKDITIVLTGTLSSVNIPRYFVR